MEPVLTVAARRLGQAVEEIHTSQIKPLRDEIERLRAKEKDWAEVFDAQKSVIGRLVDTLHEIKRCNAHYNFGSKLVRLVDAALEKLP